jgi:hypothetical protein
MYIKRWLTEMVLLLVTVVWGMAAPLGVQAVTIEDEEGEDEELFEAPTPVPAKARPVSAQAAPAAVHNKVAASETSEEAQEIKADSSPTQKVRINRNVSFYYFLRAGYIVSNSSEVPSLGGVFGVSGELGYSAPKKMFIRLASPDTEVKEGDLWVVYRMTDQVSVPKSGFRGFWVRNLAVVKVLEVQKNRCQVQVVKSFGVISNGDKVKPYDVEIQRWKDAHLKKPLPAQPIQCVVAGGEPNHEQLTETDFIILTAGSKKGVVEGQIFELRSNLKTDPLEKPVKILNGKAQVFYVGPNYAMARILKSSVGIQKDFEAHYQP